MNGTAEMTDEELDLMTQPTAEEIFEELDPSFDDLDISDELNPLVDPTEAEKPDPMVLIAELQAQLDALKKAPKNQVAGKPGNRSYVRQGPLSFEGKVPQQQADLAKILTDKMPVGETFTEAQVFAFLESEKHNHPSLVNSKQDVTYLFRYYRGLKQDGKHGGFVARGFLKQS